jgi:hypothetical protein
MWAVRDKTHNQMQKIMGMTVRAGAFHLDRAQTRLGAATFTEAVVRVARGLIKA